MLSTLGVFAQLSGTKQKDVIKEDNVFFDGITSDYYTGERISSVTISAVADGKVVASGTSDGNGEYKMVLLFDKEYVISFSKPGFISKTITLSTFGVPDNKRHKVPDMNAEITLFKPNECIKAEMLDKPVGRAVYFADKNIIDWDMVYSMPLLEKLNEMLDDCSKQQEKEQQKEKEYTNTIKEADKAFAKQDWEEAKKSYEKALQIFSNKPEPKEKLKLIDTEISKKAEAEKQRAEEKARAEAEAKAKAVKEAAAKKAEAEKLAKEAAEKEVLVKAEAEKQALAKAAEAAKLAEKERLAKEQKEKEAAAKKEAELKEKLEKEALTKQQAEEAAKLKETQALEKAKEEGVAKVVAQAEAKQRAEKEAQALKAKEEAEKRELVERSAKEKAAKLAEQAEAERAENMVNLVKQQEEVKEEVAKFVEEETVKPTEISGSSSITIKGSNKGRYLYEVPNRTGKGKGARPKKHVVF